MRQCFRRCGVIASVAGLASMSLAAMLAAEEVEGPPNVKVSPVAVTWQYSNDGGQTFADKQPYHTLLFDDREQFRREDVCTTCWQTQFSQGASDRKGFVSYWQGVYEAPPATPEGNPAIADTRVAPAAKATGRSVAPGTAPSADAAPAFPASLPRQQPAEPEAAAPPSPCAPPPW